MFEKLESGSMILCLRKKESGSMILCLRKKESGGMILGVWIVIISKEML